ncbi:MAG: ATP-binding cassette domain-containing protein [Clostridia bacterium]|nr:ATP-binding cassette domain-containing protein [Clostridia bacterium]
MIKTVNLCKNFKDKKAVIDLNLEIKKGELFSLLGVNGAGKTTTIKMLSTLSNPSSGDIFIKGENLKENPNKIKRIMNLSPQETAIAPNLTVKENLLFMAGVYQIKDKTLKVNKLLNTFKLEEIQNKKAGILSGGQKRKLSIALALTNDPEILFLDEPTLGLDVLSRRELWKTIEELKGKTTIILTTHYLEEAESLSDRIGIMVNGKLSSVGTAKELIALSGEKDFENAFVKIATGGEL